MTINRGYIYLGLATVAFSTMELVGKIISTSLHPFQITFWRFAIGSLILLPFALSEMQKRKLSFKSKDYWYLVGLGLLCIVVCMTFFQIALLYTQASIVAVVFCSNPIFTIPFAALILKEKINWTTIISLVLGIAGVIIIMQPFMRLTDLNLKGSILAFLAAITWSLYSVVGKAGIARYGGMVQNCFSFIAGILGLFPLFFVLNIPLVTGIGAANLGALLYLGVFVSGMGFFFYFQGMGLTSASKGSIVFFIKPALATVLSGFFLGEPLSANLIIGIILIGVGSICLLQKNHQPIGEIKGDKYASSFYYRSGRNR
ncbi:MAG: EamA family transporter [Syntrophomonadaceae bacterium]|nr:EamA family transporter [Syntrophomonadaceae bacterium]